VAIYLIRNLKLPARLAAQLRILALLPQASAAQDKDHVGMWPAWYGLGLVLHLSGITLVITSRSGWPLWIAPLALLVIMAPQLPVLFRRRRPSLIALTPLVVAYAATVLWLVLRWLDITCIGWQGLSFPDPFTSFLYLDGIILGSAVFAVLCQLSVTSSVLVKPELLWRSTAGILVAAVLLWVGVVYLGKRTHGVTASDPYAYAQMAIDLAERGTLTHRFSLFQEVASLEIAWGPLVPVGYHIPLNELGDAPSVWATGAAIPLAAGYALAGEPGLYLTTPLIAMLDLAVTWKLANEALQGESRAVRYLTGTLAVALLATSPEYVDRLLVPMADAAAQLFTVLTLLFAIKGMHQLQRGQMGVLPFLVSGVCFATAYWIRHTQLVLVLPVLMAIVLGGRISLRREAPDQSAFLSLANRFSTIVIPLLAFAGAALVTALPDILYRWRIFGGPLATETTELPLMALSHIGPVALKMLGEALAAGEWGYLFPLAAYGAYRLGRDRRGEAIVLACAFFAVLLVHLPYRALRLRDLISIFPILDIAIAYGAIMLVRRVRRIGIMEEVPPRLVGALLPATVTAWVVFSLALARWAMIDDLWKPGWASFGYMQPNQRAAFDNLAELTPPEAVVGASLNAGALSMYTGRDSFRPYDGWSRDEWELFAGTMQSAGRPIYLLDDGKLMAEFIAAEEANHSLTLIERLQVPLFGAGDRQLGWLYLVGTDEDNR
jgi:hypothetical protein